jgi:hypothetical protein
MKLYLTEAFGNLVRVAGESEHVAYVEVMELDAINRMLDDGCPNVGMPRMRRISEVAGNGQDVRISVSRQPGGLHIELVIKDGKAE